MLLCRCKLWIPSMRYSQPVETILFDFLTILFLIYCLQTQEFSSLSLRSISYLTIRGLLISNKMSNVLVRPMNEYWKVYLIFFFWSQRGNSIVKFNTMRCLYAFYLLLSIIIFAGLSAGKKNCYLILHSYAVTPVSVESEIFLYVYSLVFTYFLLEFFKTKQIRIT